MLEEKGRKNLMPSPPSNLPILTLQENPGSQTSPERLAKSEKVRLVWGGGGGAGGGRMLPRVGEGRREGAAGGLGVWGRRPSSCLGHDRWILSSVLWSPS